MISNKILTILNVIIFLSYCRANGDLNEEEFNKNCVASLKMIGFKYDSGFVNYCNGIQFHEKMIKKRLEEEAQEALQPYRDRRNFKEMTDHQWEGMQKDWLDGMLKEAVTKHLAEERNKDDTFKKMTEHQWEDQVQVVFAYYDYFRTSKNNYQNIEIKTPEEFCIEGLNGTCCFMGYVYKLICTNQILQKYDKLNRYENVKIAYNELGWNENMSEEQMNYFIGHLPNDSKKQQYFKYLGKLILKYNKDMTDFVVKTWCKNHYKTIHNKSKDSTLANEENEDNGTD